jgi:hypothetical protein
MLDSREQEGAENLLRKLVSLGWKSWVNEDKMRDMNVLVAAATAFIAGVDSRRKQETGDV